MTADDILARVGLQTRTTTADLLLPALGVFGVGMFVGAGVALALAPKSGPEFRSELGRRAASLRDRMRFHRNETIDTEARTRDELYTEAQELEINGRSEMSKAELAQAVRSASQ